MRAYIFFAILIFSLKAQATVYTAMETPAGFAGAAGQFTYSSSTASASGGAFSTTSRINVGGQTLSEGMSLPFGAGIGRAAGLAARGLNAFGTAAALWDLAQWLKQNGLQWQADTQQWLRTSTSSSATDGVGILYSTSTPTTNVNSNVVGSSPSASCSAWGNAIGMAASIYDNSRCAGVSALGTPVACCGWGVGGATWVYKNSSVCASGYTMVSGACTQTTTRVATVDDFNNLPDTIPEAAAAEAATVAPLPVKIPVMIGFDAPIGQPRLDPVSGRLVQDGVRIDPAFTSDNPTRVAVTSYTKDAGAVTGQTSAAPAATTANNVADSSVKNNSDLCTLHPEVAACQTLDTPTTPDLQTKSINVAITPDSGWGAASYSCPVDPKMSLGSAGGKSFSPVHWAPTCDAVGKLKYLIIALAWFAAAWIFIDGARS